MVWYEDDPVSGLLEWVVICLFVVGLVGIMFVALGWLFCEFACL